MGIQSFFSSIANIYNKVKSGVSEVYNFGQKIVHGIHSGMDEIDKFLDKASSIPFVGMEIQEGLDELRDFQIAGFSWNNTKKRLGHLDEWMSSNELQDIASNLDAAITSTLEAGEAYGGIVDQTFTGGSQVMGGVQV